MAIICKCAKTKEPPCTERYARWCERSGKSLNFPSYSIAQEGKKRLTDVANTEQLLRIIQSIPSKKAEPFKVWLAQVGRERIEEAITY
ncbi:MAG: hypothetical protein J5965_05560 [Aeriscardovia sp.]|nr:hypothetical protein [Aeriscardovia sp.]